MVVPWGYHGADDQEGIGGFLPPRPDTGLDKGGMRRRAGPIDLAIQGEGKGREGKGRVNGAPTGFAN